MQPPLTLRAQDGASVPRGCTRLITACRPIRSPAASHQRVRQEEQGTLQAGCRPVPRSPVAPGLTCGLLASPGAPALGRGRGSEGAFPPHPSRASQQARLHGCWQHPPGRDANQPAAPPEPSSREERRVHRHLCAQAMFLSPPLTSERPFLPAELWKDGSLEATTHISPSVNLMKRGGGIWQEGRHPPGQTLVPRRQGWALPVSVSPEPTDAEGGGGERGAPWQRSPRRGPLGGGSRKPAPSGRRPGDHCASPSPEWPLCFCVSEQVPSPVMTCWNH